MRVLGIDPGLNITGYGLVDFSKDKKPRLLEAGLIRTKPSFTLAQKLFRIHKGIIEIISEFKPGVLVLEELYSNYDYPRTAILMGHARGVIALAAQESKILLVGYSPLRIRKALLGRGNVTKDQVARMVQHFLGLSSLPETRDITDALALALAYGRIEVDNPFRETGCREQKQTQK